MPKPAAATIRRLRQDFGVRVGKFSAMAGVSRGHMIGIENGRNLASIEALTRIAKVLGVSDVNTLIAESEPEAGAA